MKLTRVSFQCFGAFPDSVSIDLTEIGREGLFLICGDTGAGKTTLLDAICYALYYVSSSGKGSTDPGKGNFDSMRSRYVSVQDKRETAVSVELEKNGILYRFTRKLIPKKRAVGFDEIHSYERYDDGWQPVMANAHQRNVTQAAEKLIGLTADQFRQIIILPQGRFEQLLTSTSDEKEAVLSSLFHVGQWQDAAERLKEQCNQERIAIQSEKNAISAKLAMFSCSDLQALQLRITEENGHLPTLSDTLSKAEAALKEQQECQTQAAALEQLFVQLDKRSQAVDRLTAQADHYCQRAALLAAAQSAENLRPEWNTVNSLRQNSREAKAALDSKILENKAAVQAQAAVQDAWKTHESKRADYDRSRDDMRSLQLARPAYAEYDKHTQAVLALTRQVRQAAKYLEGANQTVQTAADALVQAEANVQRLSNETNHLRRLYTLSAAGRLASILTDGEACPVCGSTHHPIPAQLSPDHVSDEQVTAAQRQQQLAREAYQAAAQHLNQAKDDHTKAVTTHTELTGQYNAAAQLAANALSRLIDGITDTKALEKKLALYAEARTRFEQDEEKLKPRLESAQSAVNQTAGAVLAAREHAEALQAKLAQAEAHWQEALGSAGIPDEDTFHRTLMTAEAIEALRSDINGYHADLAHAQQELSDQQQLTTGRSRPDLQALQTAYLQCKTARDEAAGLLSGANDRIRQMTVLSEGLDTAAHALAEREQAWIRRDEFVGMLNNTRGFNLHRYVLAAMLDSVITQANYLLTRVHEGRYSLRRSDTASGRKSKAGLELNVEDHRTGCIRSVKSLSGGEKFLVSLALAIGLNEIMQAQSQGIRVEAIFVDEGFGTLDNDSVQDAMQMLNTVRLSRGMVGIISHVDALRSEIPVHIEVHKDVHHGSTLVV